MTDNNIIDPVLPVKKRSRSFFWPILLISIGVLTLLSNLGILSWSSWNLIWRFWPLVLIAAGIDVLFGRRSTLGAIISAFLILALIGTVAGAVYFADQLPVLNRFTAETSWKTDHVEQALEDYQQAVIYIDTASPQVKLSSLENSTNLIEGDLTYQGELIFEVDSRGSIADISLDTRLVDNWISSPFQSNSNASWEIYLSPEIPLDLSLDTSSGSCDFDLSDLLLEEFFLDSGSGSINLAFPEGQSYSVRIDSGSGSLRIDLPAGTGVQVNLDSGSGSFNPGTGFSLISGEKRGDGTWQSDNYGSAKYTIEMEIDQGSGSISFK